MQRGARRETWSSFCGSPSRATRSSCVAWTAGSPCSGWRWSPSPSRVIEGS